MITAAETICGRLNAVVAVDSRTERTLTAIARSADRLARVEQAAVNELAKLNAPARLNHDWRLIVAYRQKLANNVVALSQDAQRGEVAKFDPLGTSNRAVMRQLLTTAKHAGLNNCSYVG